MIIKNLAAPVRRLVLAAGVGGLGARITREGLPLTAVLVLHAGPAQVGLLAAAAAAPSVLVGLAAGPWIDASRRRNVMVICDLGRATLLALVPILAVLHQLHMALVLLAGSGVAAMSAAFDMAVHAELPRLTPLTELDRANSALGAADSLAEVAGPPLTGLLVSLFTAPLAIVANCLTYIGSALILLRLPAPSRLEAQPDADIGWLTQIAEGLRWTLTHPTARALLATYVTLSFFGSFFGATYIPFAISELGLSPALLGAVIAFGGLGALGGAAVAPWISRRLGAGRGLVLAIVLAGLSNLLIPLAHGGPWIGAAFLIGAQILGDLWGTVLYVLGDTLRQAAAPERLLGRSAGAFAAASGLAGVLGAATAGLLAARLGMRPVMVVDCLGSAAAALWCLMSPVINLRDASQAAVDPL